MMTTREKLFMAINTRTFTVGAVAKRRQVLERAIELADDLKAQ